MGKWKKMQVEANCYASSFPLYGFQIWSYELKSPILSMQSIISFKPKIYVASYLLTLFNF